MIKSALERIFLTVQAWASIFCRVKLLVQNALLSSNPHADLFGWNPQIGALGSLIRPLYLQEFPHSHELTSLVALPATAFHAFVHERVPSSWQICLKIVLEAALFSITLETSAV